MAKSSPKPTPIVERTADEQIEERVVTAEEILELLKRSKVVAADRLVIIRSFEKFFSANEGARGILLSDINEINNAIRIRDGDVIPEDIPEDDASNTEEE